jgi:hypothetical protein
MKANCKVKTTKVGCCSIEDNTVYEAFSEGEVYISVLLTSGEWTSPHWNGQRFEIIERYSEANAV